MQELIIYLTIHHLMKRALTTFASSFVLSTLTALSIFPAFVLAAPYLTLDRFSGNPGTLTISGGGLEAGDMLSIYLREATGTPFVTTTIASDGTFSVSPTIPLNTMQGHLPIIGIDSHGTRVENSFYAVSFAPSISVVAPNNTPLNTIQVSGTGFGANEQVTISLQDGSSNTTADTNGSFNSANFTIPNVPAGLYLLSAGGQSSGASTTHYFYVNGFYPSVFPSSYYLLPGQTLSFTGSGFAPNESIALFDTTTTLATFTADASGSFTDGGSFTIPFDYAGTVRNFRIEGSTTGASFSVPIPIEQFWASVTPSSYYVMPGSTLSFSGARFAPGETVHVRDATSATLAEVVTNTLGSFANGGAVTVPLSARESISYTLSGLLSKAEAAISVGVGSFYPSLLPSSYFVQPGTTITLSGFGFGTNEGVEVMIDGIPVTTASATSSGSFAPISLVIPFSDSELATISAKGVLTGAETSVSITRGKFYPTVSPSAYYLYPGDSLTFTGMGFVPGEQVSAARGTTPLPSITADSSGNISTAPTTIPFGTSGAINFTFVGALSKATTTAEVTLGNRFSFLSADTYYTKPGTTVNVHGMGFAPGERVSVNASGVMSEIGTGSFGITEQASVLIPYGTTTPLRVIFTGLSSGVTSFLDIGIAKMMTLISPNSYYENPGTTIHVSGSDFAPGEIIDVTAGAFITTATADTTGNVPPVDVALPFGTGSDHVLIKFSGRTSGAETEARVWLAPFYPWINLSDYYDIGGAPLTIFGHNFAPGEEVVVNSGDTTVGSKTADTSGAFELESTVPFGPAGEAFIYARGALSGATSESSLTRAQIYTSVGLDRYGAPPGGAMTYTGSGYIAGDTIVISSTSTGLISSCIADAVGSVECPFTLPSTLIEGPLTLTIRGTNSFDTKEITIYVTGL